MSKMRIVPRPGQRRHPASNIVPKWHPLVGPGRSVRSGRSAAAATHVTSLKQARGRAGSSPAASGGAKPKVAGTGPISWRRGPETAIKARGPRGRPGSRSERRKRTGDRRLCRSGARSSWKGGSRRTAAGRWTKPRRRDEGRGNWRRCWRIQDARGPRSGARKKGPCREAWARPAWKNQLERCPPLRPCSRGRCGTRGLPMLGRRRPAGTGKGSAQDPWGGRRPPKGPPHANPQTGPPPLLAEEGNYLGRGSIELGQRH